MFTFSSHTGHDIAIKSSLLQENKLKFIVSGFCYFITYFSFGRTGSLFLTQNKN